MQVTVQGRLKGEFNDSLLHDFATLYTHATHDLFALHQSGQKPAKSGFMLKHGLTSREYNALDTRLSAIESSRKELRKMYLLDKDIRLKAIDKKIRDEEKKKEKKKPYSPKHIHGLKRKKHRLEEKIEKLRNDIQPHICFGSKNLFHKQFHLQENGYTNHAQWYADWALQRASEFFVMGSKDERTGCSECTLRYEGNNTFRFRLRLPNTFATKYFEHTVQIDHGSDVLITALAMNRALSYLFKYDVKRGWRILISTDKVASPKITLKSLGAIGVDFNVGFFAVTETNHHGNIINSFNVPCVLDGLSRNQRRTVLSEAVKTIVTYAKNACKPCAIEILSFAEKKAQLSQGSPGMNRMLALFATSAFLQLMTARCNDAGVELIQVNPAYTSKIGKQKYSRRYGRSVHQSAALVIARRGQQMSDIYRTGSHRCRIRACKDATMHRMSTYCLYDPTLVTRKPLRSTKRNGDPPTGNIGSKDNIFCSVTNSEDGSVLQVDNTRSVCARK